MKPSLLLCALVGLWRARADALRERPRVCTPASYRHGVDCKDDVLDRGAHGGVHYRSAGECCALCAADPRCKAWTWYDDQRVCFLKSACSRPIAKDAVSGCDIVVTATSSRSPIVMDEWVGEGTHINCIGADAPGKQELDPRILKRARVIIDDWEQASHSGEINVPLSKGELTKDDVNDEIGRIVAGLSPGRQSDAEITVFCSTGLAVQDSLTAKIVYDAASKANIGRFVQIVL